MTMWMAPNTTLDLTMIILTIVYIIVNENNCFNCMSYKGIEIVMVFMFVALKRKYVYINNVYIF